MLLRRYSVSQRLILGPSRPQFRRAVLHFATAHEAPETYKSGPETPSVTSDQIHVTIVGGGAAGLTAAFFAAEHGAKVTVLERTREAGKKILMSGGSRCNVLPLEVDLQTDFHSESSFSAVKAVFASWNLDLCKAWLEDPYWGVGLDLQLEEETKKYFPSSNSSREVRDRLVAACLARGVEFKYNASVEGLQPLTKQQQPQALLVQAPDGGTELAGACTAADTTGGRVGPLDASSASSVAAAVTVTADGNGDGRGARPGDDGAAESNEARRASGSEAGPSSGGGSAATASSADVASASGGAAGGRGGKKGSRNARARAAAAAAEATAAAGRAAAEGGPGHDGDRTDAVATRWLCKLRDGSEHVADKLIIATGGLSFPAVGTDGTGHRLLRALGHTLQEPYPALTPLTGRHPAGEQLAGVSMYDIELSVQVPGTKRPKVSERTALLFTHRGYSGPAVLDLSHHAVKALTRGSVPPPPPPPPVPSPAPPSTQPSSAAPQRQAVSGGGTEGGAAGAPQSAGYLAAGLPSIRVNWTHESAAVWDERIKAGGTALVTTLLQRHGLRERLAEALVSELGLVARRVCDVKKAERAALVSALTSYELPYHGHEGYKKAEVTGGGVRLEELNCATMESRILPGLFLCGECVDVFGRIGGFNFYWAWVSGRLAGIGAAQGGLTPPSARKAERRRRGGDMVGSTGGSAVAASAYAS